MKPTGNSTAQSLGSPLRSDVAAFGSVQVTLDKFPALRQRPGPGVGQSLPNNFLKHVDEQTVAALAAVLQAIEQFGLAETRFSDWGVVAAPAFLGRATLVVALQRHGDEGAWGVSPHFIPHRSQHAVAGTISQALKIHGPNFGTGGGPQGAAEALLAGAVLLEGNQLPGIWIALAGWEPEQIPDLEGKPITDSVCRAVAFALVPPKQGSQGIRLHITTANREELNGSANGSGHDSRPTLEVVQEALSGAGKSPRKLVWSLNRSTIIELKLGLPDEQVEEPAMGHGPVGRVREFGQAGAGTEKKR